MAGKGHEYLSQRMGLGQERRPWHARCSKPGASMARHKQEAILLEGRLTRTTIADYWRTRDGLPTSSLEALLAAGWPPAAPPLPVYTLLSWRQWCLQKHPYCAGAM